MHTMQAASSGLLGTGVDTRIGRSGRSSGHRHSAWTKNEDEKLKRLVEEEQALANGATAWTRIARRFEGRSGKQVRERYLDHLAPGINRGPWTPEEETLLVNLHRRLGDKWLAIARGIPGRPGSVVKNRFNMTKRMAHRFPVGEAAAQQPLAAYVLELAAGAPNAGKASSAIC